ncbi:MAG: 30S ribosomal protein S18 [Anaerolineales bacterium]|nr:30S ribosomal protein S18 [Anaerolineales bacterium]
MDVGQETPRTEESTPSESSGGGGGGGGRGRGGYVRKPRVCQFCVEKINVIDYKQADMLRKFVMERGKIRPRRQTGTCALHQRALAVAVKRARHMALLPFADE